MNKYLVKKKLMRKIANLILNFLRYIYLIKINKFEIEISILSKIINKDNICLDIGCCHGSYARIMSKFGKFVYAVPIFVHKTMYCLNIVKIVINHAMNICKLP